MTNSLNTIGKRSWRGNLMNRRSGQYSNLCTSCLAACAFITLRFFAFNSFPPLNVCAAPTTNTIHTPIPIYPTCTSSSSWLDFRQPGDAGGQKTVLMKYNEWKFRVSTTQSLLFRFFCTYSPWSLHFVLMSFSNVLCLSYPPFRDFSLCLKQYLTNNPYLCPSSCPTAIRG